MIILKYWSFFFLINNDLIVRYILRHRYKYKLKMKENVLPTSSNVGDSSFNGLDILRFWNIAVKKTSVVVKYRSESPCVVVTYRAESTCVVVNYRSEIKCVVVKYRGEIS